ncbi:YeiH family protein [Collimonas humicola]|uniref:YeiH family protein n=1 Tax=Collimonas humicola TaxID=2825886 RepID=UPI001B8BE189|nr:YeiH family protein [Collimonas humicola]
MNTSTLASAVTTPKTRPPLLAGLALSGLIAAAAIAAARIGWLQAHGFSALTLAIVIGMLVGNLGYRHIAPACAPGVNFSKQNLLRLGIILYGFRLTFQDIGHVGLSGVLIDALVLCSTFGMALLLGTRVFKLDRNTAMLIGAGSSICGAAAVMATEPVLRAHPAQVTVAVATVVVFGSLAIFLYPLLYQLNLHWQFLAASPLAYGIFTGSTVHEVAQVVAAARAVSPDAANTAVIAKMVRVMMLAPFLMLLSAYVAKNVAKNAAKKSAGAVNSGSAKPSGAGRLAIPWFAFGFVAVVALNSLAALPSALVAHVNDADNVLLAMAMAALGISTHFSSIRTAGIKPLLFAACLFGWLIVGGAMINNLVLRLFA